MFITSQYVTLSCHDRRRIIYLPKHIIKLCRRLSKPTCSRLYVVWLTGLYLTRIYGLFQLFHRIICFKFKLSRFWQWDFIHTRVMFMASSFGRQDVVSDNWMAPTVTRLRLWSVHLITNRPKTLTKIRSVLVWQTTASELTVIPIQKLLMVVSVLSIRMPGKNIKVTDVSFLMFTHSHIRFSDVRLS